MESFENFGYQLFEPNVRCELKNSRVNAAIKKQVSTKKGIDEFRYLNNGVTIIGDNHSQHGDGSTISITRPGVVNGLQTITTLAECYEHMTDPELKAYFKNECAILVRLYDKKTIPVTELVKATNNQNPMEPRNLMSNEPEQVVNEQMFAKLGWFYERKQFAWEAFIQDERQWPTLKNLKKQHFQVQKGKAGRPTQRRVDNEDLMQVWLAFVGFLNEAVQKRREFFTNARFYERVFKSRLTKHGFDYDYQWGDDTIDDEALAGGVSATAFLLANSTALIASEFIPSGRQLRDERVAALNLGNRSREEQDAKLNEDSQYLAGLVKSAATLLFTELCGFVLLRALSGTFYEKAETILQKTDIRAVFEELDFSAIEKQVASGNPPKDALFSQLWLLFLAVVDDLVDSEVWRNSFFQQSSRPRFMYSAETRKKLLRIVTQWDQTASKRPLNRPWSLHFDKGQGIFRGIGQIIRSL